MLRLGLPRSNPGLVERLEIRTPTSASLGSKGDLVFCVEAHESMVPHPMGPPSMGLEACRPRGRLLLGILMPQTRLQ